MVLEKACVEAVKDLREDGQDIKGKWYPGEVTLAYRDFVLAGDAAAR